MTQAEGDAKSNGPEPGPGGPAKGPTSDEQLQRLKRRPPTAQERYRLEGEIGRGGMGAVLRVRDLDLRRTLAMKVVLGPGSVASGVTPAVDPQVLQRFLDEAQITGQLDHPGVVPVHELGLDADGRVYFTMKLVKGDTADVVFTKARNGVDSWTESRALEVILKVCDTMSFAHQKGVLHRDLKPSNVMVGKFGEVYVMDWGLAKVLGEPDRRDLRIRPESTLSKVLTDRSKAEADSDSPLLTMDGAVVGTPCYMAPEQAEGRIEVLDQRADVYAVGAMLYQLLTGQQPYVTPGARVSPYAVLAAVQAGPPQAVHALRQGVPGELNAICDKAMARDLARRYAGMRELSDDLRAFLEKRVVRAYRTGPGAELVMWLRRNRALAAAMVAVVLLLAGAIATSTYAFGAAGRADAEAQLRQQSDAARERLLQAAADRELAARIDELSIKFGTLMFGGFGADASAVASLLPACTSLLREAGVDLGPDAVAAARTNIAALRARDAGLADALIELLHILAAMPGLDSALRTSLAILLAGYEDAHSKAIAAARTRWDDDRVDTFGPLLEESELQNLGADQLANLAGSLIDVPDRGTQWSELLDRAILMKPDSYKLQFMRGGITAMLASRSPQGLEAERLARTAIMHLQAAIALRPHSGLARASLARAQAVLATATDDRGSYGAAWQTMESATRVDPDNAVVWFFCADFLRRSPGRATEAIAACEKALQLDRSFTPASKLLAELRR